MSLRVAIMQPYSFPYIGYFQLIQAVDIFIFLDDVNYIKRGWINRNNILINGQASSFVIPCKNVSQNRPIKDTLISWGEAERKKELRKIELAYKRADQFEAIMPLVEDCFLCTALTISDFAQNSIKKISDYLDLKVNFLSTSIDFSGTKDLKGSARLKSICKIVGATEYVNPIGGTELYSKDEFERENVSLFFLKSDEDLRYKQFAANHFVPWLSIIDVLMFNNIEEVKVLLTKYRLL